jgi:hypothetical protein
VIDLNTPGNYRLIGAGVGISNPQNPNEIIVGTEDAIRIKGPGKYNVILDNVNIDIDINRQIKDRTYIFYVGNADVNLILEGENNLKNNDIYSNGLRITSQSNVTIEAASAESSLNINNIKCLDGRIEVINGIVRVFGKLEINTPGLLDYKVDQIEQHRSWLKVNGGKLLSLPLDYFDDISVDKHIKGEIIADDIIMNNGEVIANTVSIMYKLIVNDGKISGDKIFNNLGGRMFLNGGVVEANDVYMGRIIINKGELLTNHIYDEPFNGKTIKEFKKRFALLDDEGVPKVLSENGDNGDYKVGYILTDPYGHGHRYLYITGGTINGIEGGIGFSLNVSEDRKLKDNGKTFVGGNPANNFCDMEIDFAD